MTNENTKNEGPACACSRGDLYEEWLKQNDHKEQAEVQDPTSEEDKNSSADVAVTEVQKPKIKRAKHSKGT